MNSQSQEMTRQDRKLQTKQAQGLDQRFGTKSNAGREGRHACLQEGLSDDAKCGDVQQGVHHADCAREHKMEEKFRHASDYCIEAPVFEKS